MTVRRSLAVDRALQVEVAHDRSRTQVERVANGLLDLRLFDLVRAERFHEDADGLRHTDGVGHLHFATTCSAGRHHVLGHPASGVRSRAVDLRGVFAAERSTAVATHAAVRVDDDLATGQTGVGVRSTLHELACRVHVHRVVVFGELRRDRRTNHLLDEVGPNDGVARDAISMLRADEHGTQTHRDAVFVVERDLGLAVGAKVWHGPGLTHLGELLSETMREVNRQRHQFGRLVARITEHHALVAGTLRIEFVLAALATAQLFALVDTHRDIARLFVDADDYAAGVAVEAICSVVVADFFDGVAGQLGNVDVRRCGDLACHHAQAGGEQGLTSDTTVRVFSEDGVEY